jgi:hypothetical protein
MAAISRTRRSRRGRRIVVARALVWNQQHRLAHRHSGPRLVLPHRLARPRVRDHGGQFRCVQGAVDRHLRQRLRRGAGATGVEIFKARIGGGGHTFSSSPLASQGRIYMVCEDGDTFVIRAGDRYEELAHNTLDEMSLATPAADADGLYLRTQTRLYRIRNTDG